MRYCRPALGGAALLAVVAGFSLVATAAPQWTEATKDVGIKFRHAGSKGLEAQGDTFLTVNGGGACFADYDGDGYEDLYVTNRLYETDANNEKYDPHSSLFKNNGDGTFTEVSEGSGADLRTWASACAAADYDADGDIDLFVTAYAENTLLRNDGPFKFTNVTLEAGVSSIGKCPDDVPCWGHGVSFVDADGDDCLDIYIANYVEFRQGDTKIGPDFFDGQKNLFYHSNCDGTFTEETDKWNLDDDPGEHHSKAFMNVWADYDRDGDLDCYVASDTTDNSLFRNNGDGTFTDVAPDLGVDDPRASMGLEFQDSDGNGLPDLFMTHYSHEENGYYLNLEGPTFEDHSGEGDLGETRSNISWGTFFFDYDNDGDPDLYVLQGETVDLLDNFRAPRHLFRNDGAPTFKDVTADSGPGMANYSVGRGAAYADFDFDGDLDIVNVNTGDAPNRGFDNGSFEFLEASGVGGNWLQIQLRQPGMNRLAIGAEITVTPAGLASRTHVAQTSQSYLSQNSAYYHFGLGDATTADVEIRWPDGTVETWTGVADGVARLTRGVTRVVTDTLAPVTSFSATGTLTNGWHTEIPTITLSADDRAVGDASGVDRTEYRLDGGDWTAYDDPFTIGEGEHTLEYRSIDAEGTVEPVREQTVRVDLTNPTSRAIVNGLTQDGWFTEISSITLLGDDAESGIDRIERRVDGGAWVVYSDAFRLSGEGPRTIEHRAIDVSGRVETTPGSISLRLDTLPPKTTLGVDGPRLDDDDGRTHVTSDSLVLLLATDGGSGVAATEYRLDGGEWTSYEGGFRLTGDDGERRLEFRSRDHVHHNETVRTVRLVLDNHTPPPLLVFEPQRSAVYVSDNRVSLAAAAPDGPIVVGAIAPLRVETRPDVQGNTGLKVYVDGVLRWQTSKLELQTHWNTLGDTPGKHVLRFETADGGGNVRAQEIEVIVVGTGVRR